MNEFRANPGGYIGFTTAGRVVGLMMMAHRVPTSLGMAVESLGI